MMKKLILFICVCALFSCKKENVDDITKFNWVLKTATRTPGKMYNGKLETDYIESDPSTCLKNNYTIVFSNSGTYSYASNGPLCDLVANDNSLKWTQNGNQITLINTRNNNSTTDAKLEGTQLTYTTTHNDNGTNYTIVWKFIAKSK
jgi:hypothetical protein